MAYAVKFEGVSKRYPRGWSEGEEPRYASFRYDIATVGQRILGRRGPRGPNGTLALEDVSFEVQEGESFALIGPNGAGKSTALKLISRISYPTSGRLRIRGRVAALMEVGSGVHPELTGRENIWLYGQILGLSKADVRRRFDEIVAFAELEKAIDTPVKFFSIGMQLRLGFSIAAHLQPDVFVVDEALAVGDAAFQAKCIERMSYLVTEGHTLLFVSHALEVVREVCDQAVLLDQGRVVAAGSTQSVLNSYLSRVQDGAISGSNRPGAIMVTRLEVIGGIPDVGLRTGQSLELAFHLDSAVEARDVNIEVNISDGRLGFLTTFSLETLGELTTVPRGESLLRVTIPSLPLLPGEYEVFLEVSSPVTGAYVARQTFVGLIVVGEGPEKRRKQSLHARVAGVGPIDIPFEMELLSPRSADDLTVTETQPNAGAPDRQR